MLVFNDNDDIYNNVQKSNLPAYVDKLQFSISGENVSVGHGFGDSSFNVFGDSTLSGVLHANGGINTTIINSNIINVFDKLDVSGTGINFTNGYIGISQGGFAGPIRIGYVAGNSGQGIASVAIGNAAGEIDQSNNSVAIGASAGSRGQSNNSVAIGYAAGQTDQSNNSVAIGALAGNGGQSNNSVAIGYIAGVSGQGSESVAIGYNTVCTHNYSVALGKEATTTASNQIVLGTATETVKIPGQLDVSNNSLRITTTDSNCSLLINEEIGTTLTTTTGSLIISHGDRNGQSSILFRSTRNSTDYAAIQYQETDPTGDTDNEKGILRLICENDATTNHEDQIRFKTGDGDRMTIRGSGDVGIGTTSPTTTLEVVGTGKFTGVVSAATPGAGAPVTNLATLDWVNSHTSTGGGGWTTVSGSPDTLTSTANTKVVISGSGSGSLDVSGVLSFTSGYIGISAGNNLQGNYSVAIGYDAGQNTQGINSVAMGNAAGQHTQGNYSVAIGSGAGNTDQSGNSVAIGYQAGNQTQGDNSVAIGYSAGSNNQGTNSIAIGSNTVCTHNSSVALGKEATTTVDNQIVLGTATETVYVPGTLDVIGAVTAASFNSSSDVRLKENITNLDNSLDKICNIRGVNYNWKNDETKTKTAGVIAQEVLEQIPEAVIDSDSEKLSVNYNSIIAHLIESVKTLKSEINDLKGQLKK